MEEIITTDILAQRIFALEKQVEVMLNNQAVFEKRLKVLQYNLDEIREDMKEIEKKGVPDVH